MARKIVITSGKGGVGKTTVCANLGVKLANLGFRILLIDGDIGLNNLDVLIGVEKQITFTLNDILNGNCRPSQALVQDNKHQTLFMLSTDSKFDENLTAQNLKNLIEHFDNNFDYILIDCPAGVDEGFHRSVFCADEAIIVVTPHASSIRDADKVISKLYNYNLTATHLVINRVRGDMLLSGEIISIEKIIDLLDCDILGVIPEDDALSTLSSLGVFPYNTNGARAFSLLTENLHHQTKKIYDCTYKYRGVMGVIRRNIKRRV